MSVRFCRSTAVRPSDDNTPPRILDPGPRELLCGFFVRADVHLQVAELVVDERTHACKTNRLSPGREHFERLQTPSSFQKLPGFGQGSRSCVERSRRDRPQAWTAATRGKATSQDHDDQNVRKVTSIHYNPQNFLHKFFLNRAQA